MKNDNGICNYCDGLFWGDKSRLQKSKHNKILFVKNISICIEKEIYERIF